MPTTIQTQLNIFYSKHGIHPTNFRCPNQNFCRQFAYQHRMIETKMSMVGSSFGEKYPKIVVVSLDPPGQGEKFFAPDRRTTEYITELTESENYTANRPNTHWAMTQILVKDLLTLFGRKTIPGSAVVVESYSGRIIENVTPYFAHVNVAKCSMNDPDKRQANRSVHHTCSQSYLWDELKILQPDILISQGKTTNEIMGNYLIDKPVEERSLPITYPIYLSKKKVFWLPMRHPTQQLKKIQNDWPYYIERVQVWMREK